METSFLIYSFGKEKEMKVKKKIVGENKKKEGKKKSLKAGQNQ